jgi:flagellar motor switch protein FliG
LSELVDFEDLGDLDGNDLRAVLEQVAPEQLLEALGGLTPGRRRILLAKLSSASVTELEAQIVARGSVSSQSAQDAQRAIVETLCRLSRSGQVAFDDPADVVGED